MKSYEKDVIKARETKEDFRFANSIIDHARILIQNIIIDANHEVKILSDNFNEYFYAQLEIKIEEFLNKNTNQKLKIITSLEQKANNQVIIRLEKSFPNKVEVKYIDKKDFPKDDSSKETANYIVNDNCSFRYEYSDKDISSGVVNAIANFNNKEDSDLLIVNFDSIFENQVA